MGRLSLAIRMALLLYPGVLCLGAGEAAAAWWNVDHEDHRSWKVTLSGGGMFDQDLDGKLWVDSVFGDATIDLDVLDLDHEDSGWAEIDLQLFQKHHLRFLFLPLEFEGDTALQIPIDFGGISFDITDRVTSELKLHMYELSYRYDFYLGKWITLSPLIQASLIDARAEVTDVTQSVSMSESQPLPTIAIGLRSEVYPIARIGVFAEGKGFTIGDNGSMWDVQGGLRLHLIRNFFLSGSYRVIDYDIDYLGVDVDLRIQGPFVGGALRF